jgi:hypothetical protein
VEYDERLRTPLRWWVQGTMVVASLWLASAVAMPAVAALLVGAVAALVVSGFLASYGAARIQVDGVRLRAGRAQIDAGLLGAATSLDAAATRRRAGVDADARAYLLLRPYLKRSVHVELQDPDDPTPYWLMSTRRPDELARAITAATGRLTAGHVTGEDA